MLPRDEILSANDCPLQEVHVPQWDTTVYIRPTTIKEAQAMELAVDKDGKVDAPLFGVNIILDADGNRLFTDEDAEELGKKSLKALTVIMDAYNELNGLSDETVEAAGNV